MHEEQRKVGTVSPTQSVDITLVPTAAAENVVVGDFVSVVLADFVDNFVSAMLADFVINFVSDRLADPMLVPPCVG